MSVEAITWALKCPISPSSAKFVLVVMANCADSTEFLAYPSVAYLTEATGQDRKTVLENIKRLLSMGYIVDSGERKGVTKQVPVYRLIQGGNNPENGTVEQSQKRNGSENGTVPKFRINSPEIPHKQSRNSVETVPKTGHGTVSKRQEPSGNRQSAERNDPPSRISDLPIPEWLEAKAWQDWVTYRKAASGKAFTTRAAELSISALATLQAQGQSPVDVIEQSIQRSWTGLFAIKADFVSSRPSAGNKQEQLEASNRAVVARMMQEQAT